MSREQIQRRSLTLIALLMLPTAIQATSAPKSWYDDFPLGRGWMAAEGGAYEEHLVRDVGVLFLALIVATVWSVWRREAMTVMAIAWLIQGVFHFGYHVGHLEALDPTDRIGLVGSLISIPILAALSLSAGPRSPVTD